MRYKQNEPPVVYIEESDDPIKLPTKRVVCPTCDGKGTHVNPSIDGNGLSQEDFDEDPDFAEDYVKGRYDVTCYECGGCNVIEVVDDERCPSDLLQRYYEQCREARMCDRIQEMERMMGA